MTVVPTSRSTGGHLRIWPADRGAPKRLGPELASGLIGQPCQRCDRRRVIGMRRCGSSTDRRTPTTSCSTSGATTCGSGRVFASGTCAPQRPAGCVWTPEFHAAVVEPWPGRGRSAHFMVVAGLRIGSADEAAQFGVKSGEFRGSRANSARDPSAMVTTAVCRANRATNQRPARCHPRCSAGRTGTTSSVLSRPVRNGISGTSGNRLRSSDGSDWLARTSPTRAGRCSIGNGRPSRSSNSAMRSRRLTLAPIARLTGRSEVTRRCFGVGQYPGDGVDEREVTRLQPIAVQRQRPAAQGSVEEHRDHCGVHVSAACLGP